MNTWHRKYLPKAVCAVIAFLASIPVTAGTLNVSIDTTAVSGTDIAIAFDLTANTLNFNTLDILSFSAPGGTLGLPQTTGGLVTGDLILNINPAPFTDIASGSFFNELIVNLAPPGDSVTFTLSYTEFGPPQGSFPDNISLFLLDQNGGALFPTGDPLGANAALSIDLTGNPGGDVSVFSPATIDPLTGGVSLTVPGTQVATPEPATPLLVGLGGLVTLALRRRR